MASTTTSLQDRLVKLNPAPYPATSMIQWLLEALASNLSSSTLRRNTHALCSSISLSRDVCNNINTLIRASMDEDGWTSFDQYTILIDPLEELLLSLAEISESTCLQTLEGSGVYLIQQWVDAGNTWAKNRTTVYTVTEALSGSKFSKTEGNLLSPSEAVDELRHLRRHDDNSFMDELFTKASACFQTRTRAFSVERWNYFVKVKDDLETVHAGVIRDSSIDALKEYFVRLSLLIVGIFEVANHEYTNSKGTRPHVASRKVLFEVAKFAKLLAQHLSSTETAILKTERDVKWEELIRLILGDITKDGSPNLLELRKLSSTIRPPYYLQALVLVKHCRDLVEYHATKEPQPESEPVERAVKAVKDVLEKASTLSTAAITGDLNALKSKEVDSDIKLASTIVTDTFTEYSIPEKLDPAFLEKAHADDQIRYKAWASRVKLELGLNPHPLLTLPFNAKEALMRSVRVTHEYPAELLTALSLEDKVSSTSNLNMILWDECNHAAAGNARETVRKGRFIDFVNKKEIALSTMISEVQESEGRRIVQLVVD